MRTAEAEAPPPMAADSAPQPLPAAAPKFHRQSQAYDFVAAHDESTAKKLAQDAQWAAELMDKLINTKSDDAMRPGILNACTGLAFINTAKGGLGLTFARGSGFVVRKVEHDSFGHSRWSPPVYFKISQMGVGITAGYESVQSCLALMNLNSILKFTRDRTIVGTDLILVSTDGGMAGMPAGTFGSMAQMDVTGNHDNSCFAYSVASGALLNISINGTEVYPDTDANKKLYGEEPDLEAVLAGKTATFAEFLPLYRKIGVHASHAIA